MDSNHPIAIVPSGKRIRVIWRGRVIADTTRALDLTEASYPPVHYIPRSDVDMTLLRRTSHQTRCPYKGIAAYSSIEVDGGGTNGRETSDNAVWTYETPLPAVAEIAQYLAFYPSRVDSIEISGA